MLEDISANASAVALEDEEPAPLEFPFFPSSATRSSFHESFSPTYLSMAGELEFLQFFPPTGTRDRAAAFV